jgi:hypothetical protein
MRRYFLIQGYRSVSFAGVVGVEVDEDPLDFPIANLENVAPPPRRPHHSSGGLADYAVALQ